MNLIRVPAADYTPLADQFTATNFAAVPPANPTGFIYRLYHMHFGISL